MEKKVKKLQLKKETIAVLTGEKMSHVAGGNAQGCFYTDQYYQVGEVIMDGENECVCRNDGQFQCATTVVITLTISLMICPTFVNTGCDCPK